ncbi:MAG: Rpn family recombination-promoting nuclease/putative transposase [Spirochaetales bacterium]|nr:Rpn family recombination-promoting nuclease/putative transposase [Spirochaetales bacterium]MCF7938778.1 Rpn family recombination-promoting nuclease/putative transposase [Spirochaetales bacterium]
MDMSYYDHFFRTLFRSPLAAADLVRNVLPASCLQLIDLETASIEDRSFVDEDLRSHQSDLLYRDILQKKPRPKQLPWIIPVVFYHGAGRWTAPLETSLMIDGAAGEESIPRFRPFFYNIGEVDDTQVIGAKQTVAGLLALKYIRRRFTEEVSRVVSEYVHQLTADSELLHSFYVLMSYEGRRRDRAVYSESPGNEVY